MDQAIAVGAIIVLATPIAIIVGGAAYMVYPPKISSYDTIEECELCKHGSTPYCSKCWRCKWNPLYWVHKRLIYCGPTLKKRCELAKKWRNDMQPTATRCRSCGRPIVWKKTASGKLMPCEAYPVDVIPDPSSKFKALDKYGKLIPCTKTDSFSPLTEQAWEPHWDNCNAPDQHRKR